MFYLLILDKSRSFEPFVFKLNKIYKISGLFYVFCLVGMQNNKFKWQKNIWLTVKNMLHFGNNFAYLLHFGTLSFIFKLAALTEDRLFKAE